MSENQTKRCEYCGELIDINAEKCVHCGEAVNKPAPAPAPNPTTISPEKIKNIQLTPDQKVLVGKIIHIGSLSASILLAVTGLPILTTGEIGIADITVYLTCWTMAIYFLLVWKFTKSN